jgi:hypothetical protein
MEKFKIKDFTKGWFIGDFRPSLHKANDFEIAFKSYKAGEFEAAHLHKVATEFTLITHGNVSFNGRVYSKGDIVKVMPNEIVHFKSITDSETVVVKVPSVKNDKYTV